MKRMLAVWLSVVGSVALSADALRPSAPSCIVYGLQLRADTLSGGAVGLTTQVAGEARWVQAALVTNTTGGGLTGAQLTLGANRAEGPVRGLQFGTAFNRAGGDVTGAQFAIGLNHVSGTLRGAQLGGLVNWAKEGNLALQLGVVANLTQAPWRGAQLGAVVNRAPSLIGGQLGLVNLGGDVTGAQVGVINIARDVRGVQFGLINISRTMRGVPFGLITAVSEGGQRHWELYGSDVQPANLAFKLGSENVYSTFSVGAGRQWQFQYGAGLGVHLGGRLWLDTEVNASTLHAFADPLRMSNVLGQLRLLFGANLGGVQLFAGPTANTYVALTARAPDSASYLPALWSHTAGTTRVALWPGFQAGLRL